MNLRDFHELADHSDSFNIFELGAIVKQKIGWMFAASNCDKWDCPFRRGRGISNRSRYPCVLPAHRREKVRRLLATETSSSLPPFPQSSLRSTERTTKTMVEHNDRGLISIENSRLFIRSRHLSTSCPLENGQDSDEEAEKISVAICVHQRISLLDTGTMETFFLRRRISSTARENTNERTSEYAKDGRRFSKKGNGSSLIKRLYPRTSCPLSDGGEHFSKITRN